MPIRWSTFVTDAEGVVDYTRVRSLISVILAVIGGLVMIGAAVLEVTRAADLPTAQVLIMGGALVLPITGGQFGDWMGQHLQSRAVANATANAMAQTQESATP